MRERGLYLFCFWICWAGSVVLPIALFFIDGSSIFSVLAVIGFFSLVGLCLSSATGVRWEPRYAKFGMRSVGAILLTLIIGIVVVAKVYAH
jgi:predicted DNA repair protein MutK